MRDDLLQRLKLVRVHLMMLEVAASTNIVTRTCTVVHLAPLGGLLAGDAVKWLRLGGYSRLTIVRMLVLLREKAIVCAKDGM